MKPIIFLDIDGVLNAFGAKARGDDILDEFKIWGDEKLYDIEKFTLNMSKKRAEAILSLDADIVWCTTWQQNARFVGDILGIEADFLPLDQRYIEFTLDEPGRFIMVKWKRAAVEKYLRNNPRPFIWMEDDPSVSGTDNHTPFDHLHPGFIVNPHPAFGLTPEHIEDIRNWMKENGY